MTKYAGYSAEDIVIMVDGAELVRVIDDRWLCIWQGGNTADIIDLVDPNGESGIVLAPMFGSVTYALMYDLIDKYFEEKKQND